MESRSRRTIWGGTGAWPVRYGWAAVSIALATGLRLLLEPILDEKFPFSIMYFAVMFAAWQGGFGPALAAAIMGAVASAMFLLPSGGGLALQGVDNQVGMLLYLAVSFGIALLGGAMRRAQLRAEASAAESLLKRQEIETAMQERLRTEELLRVTLQSIADAVISTDAEGRVIFLNPVAAKLTGWSQQDAQGKPLFEVFNVVNGQTRHSLGDPALRAAHESLIVGLANHTVLISKDGVERAIDDSAAPIKDKTANTVGLVLVFRDVTERRNAFDALKRSEEEFRVAFESLGVGMAQVEPETGRFLRVNRKYCEITGYSADELRDLTFPEITHPADRADDLAVFQAMVRNETTAYCSEKRYIRKDGSIASVQVDGSVVRDSEGRPIRTVAIVQDVTSRKSAEESLREALAILRSFYDTAPLMMGVVEVVDDDILHLTDNRATAKFFGLSQDGPQKRLASQRGVPQAHLQQWLQHYRESALVDRPVRFDYPHQTENGIRWLSAIVSCIDKMPDGGLRCSYVVEDVSERKQIERDLVETDRRKDEFLATLAHELRNPLAPIRNSLQILKLSEQDPASARRSREMIERQVHQLVRLVDDLLDVSRVMRGKIELRRERVDLATIVSRAVETAQPMIDGQQQELTIDLPTESLLLDADPARLAQVIGNLLTNAAKYTDSQGHIWLSAEQAGEEAVLRVRDSGIGIAPEMLSKIFDLFVQADHSTTKSQGGLGIGLTLVKNLVGMHHGTVEAHSDGLGKGSEFIVRLPLVAAEKPRPIAIDEGEQRSEPKPSAAHRLLVVDDNQDAAVSLAMLLRLRGHEVRVAHDGPSALELVMEYRPELVFLDIGMPGMDGYEVARRIRQRADLEEVVVAALTGWGQEEDRRRSAEAGFDHHLVKPPEPRLIESLLAGLGQRTG